MKMLPSRMTGLYALVLIAFLSTHSAFAAFVEPVTDRAKTQLNGSWKFTTSNTLTGAEVTGFNDSGWSTVSVPHTWNSVDASSNRIADFSNSWYRKHFTIPSASTGKRIYMYFEGAFQVADVYVNGTHLGQHRGGYTRFTFDATSAINFGGDNVLAVKVSNMDCADCLPSNNARLFKGYGGLYRKAWYITTNDYHVSTTDFSSNGVYVTPSNVGSASADVSIRTVVRNSDASSKTFTVKNFITDVNQNVVLSTSQDVVIAGNSSSSVTQTGTVANPQLWQKSNPYLYNVYSNIWVDGVNTDSVHEHTGFRFYKLTATDFTLNGVSTLLRGVSKHQETEYNASAVTDAELIADWDMLVDLGVKYVRLPHYPHAELEYDLADQRGIMVWAENGNTNGGSGDTATTNGQNISREMVYQNWNHPSIIFWSAGNETDAVNATSVYAAAIKAADTSRPTVYASINGQNPTSVDFIFQNTYGGWYGGTMYDILTKKGWFSEDGAGMVLGTHTADMFAMNHTANSYEPEEYGQLVNEVIFQKLFVVGPHDIPAFSNWNARDFGDNKYKNHINSKGFTTFAGAKKDIYYLYKSFLVTQPVVNVVGADYFLRNADSNGGGDVKVYSNATNITLTVNGVNKGTKGDGGYSHPNGTVINNVFRFDNVLSLGKNTVQASDGAGTTHTITVYYKGSGSTMPAVSGDKVINLVSSNTSQPAFYIGKGVLDQRPFYRDFDNSGDNTFDVVPSVLSGANGWIATKRQSDSTKVTNLAFDVNAAADVYIMFTGGSAPSWVTSAGFADTGVTGKWRDNNLKLVGYKLYKKTVASGAHINLTAATSGSTVDYVVIVK